jgi:hypothetical protein
MASFMPQRPQNAVSEAALIDTVAGLRPAPSVSANLAWQDFQKPAALTISTDGLRQPHVDVDHHGNPTRWLVD